jgi:hypothetical protein
LSILAPSLNATNRKRSLGISGSCDQEKVRAIVGAEDNPRARVTQRQRPTLESGSSIIPTQKEFKSTVWGRAFRGRRLSMVMAPVIGVPLGRSFFFQKYDKVGTFLLTPSRGRTFMASTTDLANVSSSCHPWHRVLAWRLVGSLSRSKPLSPRVNPLLHVLKS